MPHQAFQGWRSRFLGLSLANLATPTACSRMFYSTTTHTSSNGQTTKTILPQTHTRHKRYWQRLGTHIRCQFLLCGQPVLASWQIRWCRERIAKLRGTKRVSYEPPYSLLFPHYVARSTRCLVTVCIITSPPWKLHPMFAIIP